MSPCAPATASRLGDSRCERQPRQPHTAPASHCPHAPHTTPHTTPHTPEILPTRIPPGMTRPPSLLTAAQRDIPPPPRPPGLSLVHQRETHKPHPATPTRHTCHTCPPHPLCGGRATQCLRGPWSTSRTEQRAALTLVRASTSAPRSSSSPHVVSWPLRAACMSGVHPSCDFPMRPSHSKPTR